MPQQKESVTTDGVRACDRESAGHPVHADDPLHGIPGRSASFVEIFALDVVWCATGFHLREDCGDHYVYPSVRAGRGGPPLRGAGAGRRREPQGGLLCRARPAPRAFRVWPLLRRRYLQLLRPLLEAPTLRLRPPRLRPAPLHRLHLRTRRPRLHLRHHLHQGSRAAWLHRPRALLPALLRHAHRRL